MRQGEYNDDVKQISADIPDWTRERPRQFWDPGRKLLRAIRSYQYWHKKSGIAFIANLQMPCRASPVLERCDGS